MNENISVNDIVNNNLSIFSELISNKNLTVNLQFSEEVKIRFNKELANVLISNLIKNAVKHSTENAVIIIKVTNKSFEISNNAETTINNPEDYFKRFIKENKNSKSLGIGLSIVKKISDIFELNISYKIIENIHSISFQIPDELSQS